MTTKIGKQDSHQHSRDVERARLKTEDQLRLFYDQDLVGLTITSPEKGWIRVNEHLCRMLEYSEQELRRMTWEQLTHPDDLAADVEHFDKMLAHEIEGYRLEKRFITRSGRVIPTNLVVRCVRTGSGAIDYVTAMIEDITEQEQAKKAQSESEHLYRTLVEWTPEAIIVHRRGKVLYVNPAAIKMLGATSASDLVGTPILDWVHPDIHQAFLAQATSHKQGWLDHPMTVRKLRKVDGTAIEAEVQGTIISYDGKPTVHVAMRDVTESRQAQEKLKQSEERLQLALRGSGDGFWDWNLENNSLYYSPRWWAMLGYSVDELPSDADLWRRLVHPDDLLRTNQIFASALESTVEEYQAEFRLLHKDGHYVPVLSRGFILRDASGKPVRVAGTNSDWTERKAVESTLEAARLKAERASHAKSRFLASASHDLRQPAHALGMFIARLAQLPHDAHTRHLVGSIETSVRAMQEMLDGLFDISRLDSDQTQINRVAFPVESILGPLRGSLSSAASDKGLRLRIRPSQAWVESDPGLLHRILLNLVSNAVRYTQQGSILVACRPTHDRTQLRIEVRDSGVGIAPEHHEAIFQEFFQVGNPQRDRSKGLGVGLNIVERACRLLDHPLAMRSAPGCGSCFSVTLPLMQARATRTYEDSNESAAQMSFNGLRVLLIEDDAMGRVGLASLLTSWGCRVTQAEGAQAACELYRGEQAPELIISDVRLGGGINGIEAVELLSAIAGRRIVACLISGDTDANVKEQAQAAGLTLLQKPVRPAKLRSLIRHLVQASSVQ